MTNISIPGTVTEILLRPKTGAIAAHIRFLPDGSSTEQLIGFVAGAADPVVVDAIGSVAADVLALNEELESEKTALEGQVTELTADKSTLEDTISQLQADKTALQGQVADLQAQLDALLNPPPSDVDWVGFRTAIASNAAYLRIASFNLQTTVLDSKLTWVLGAGEFDEVPALWNAIASLATPTTEEIAALNGLAETYGVPFSLNGSGLMV